MNILKLNNFYEVLGGSDRVFLNTGKLLADYGHNVHWFASSHNYQKNNSEDVTLIEPLNRPPRAQDYPRYLYNQRARTAIGNVLKNSSERFNIAHAHIYYGQLTTSIIDPIKREGIPLVQTLHEYKMVCPIYTMERDGAVCSECLDRGMHRLLVNRCKESSLVKSLATLGEQIFSRVAGDIAKVDKFICVSNFQKNLMKTSGIPDEKLVTLHNFVHLNHDTEISTPIKKHPYFFYFGRLEKLKGIDTLMEAVEKAQVKCVIAGDGPLKEYVVRRASKSDFVEYVGFINGANLRDHIRNAHAVVVPSEWFENCPMSVLEAKAEGTPVIGSRIGGIPELIRDGDDGFIFTAGNVDSLVEKLEQMMVADRSQLSHECVADIRNRFCADKHYKELISLYQSVLED